MIPIHKGQVPPMPDIREALAHVSDAQAALARHAWNRGQLADVLRSAQHFLDLARAAMPTPARPAAGDSFN